jgi:hypothetical protein
MLYGVIASRHADILAEYEKVKMYTITRQKSSAADRSKTTLIKYISMYLGMHIPKKLFQP